MENNELEKSVLLLLSTVLNSPHFSEESFRGYVSTKLDLIKVPNDEKTRLETSVESLAKDNQYFAEHNQLKHKKLRGLVDGVFDMTHFGHFNAMRQARHLCDELVVAVNDDEDVIKHKGYINQSDTFHRRGKTAASWRLPLGR